MSDIMDRLNYMTTEEKKKLRQDLLKDREALDNKAKEVEKALYTLNENLADTKCDTCLAGLDAFLHPAGEFCTDCAHYHCIYCRNDSKPCRDYEEYDTIYKEDLEKIANILYDDAFDLLKTIYHSNKTKEFINLLREMKLVE